MNKIIITLALFILSVSVISFADDSQQVITLKDGSQIKGVLSGIDNGTYTIKTPIIGDVHVAATDVASITNGNAAGALATNNTTNPAVPSQALGSMPNMDQQIAAGQQRLMSDPQDMAMIQQMAQNPKIMQALQDPALMQAVTSHDYQAVGNNPAVQEIIQDPQMHALLLKLAAQLKQQQNPPSQ